jgi:hypothetical protein
MPTTPRGHTSSLLSILAVGAALAVAACGGSNPPTPAGPSKPTTTGPIEPAEGKLTAHGTSGLAGLDWGASADAVRALYPRATAGDGGLWYVGGVEGHQAVTKFSIGANGLSQVITEWTDGFISMDDCASTWHKLRASLDGRLGPSTADNLAAYWTTPSASITLACNPNDSNAGVLSVTYAHHDGK